MRANNGAFKRSGSEDWISCEVVVVVVRVGIYV